MNVSPAHDAASLTLTALTSSTVLLGAALWPSGVREVARLLRRSSTALSIGPRRRGLAPSLPFWTTAAYLLAAFAAPLVVVEPWPALPGAPLGLVLLLLALFDARLYRLPDGLTLPLLVAGLAAAQDPDQSLAGLAMWALLPTALSLLTRRHNSGAGLGFGDVKLMAGIGAWLGPFGAALAIATAAVAAAVSVLTLAVMLRRPAREVPIAFGVFLALGLWWAWLAGAPR